MPSSTVTGLPSFASVSQSSSTYYFHFTPPFPNNGAVYTISFELFDNWDYSLPYTFTVTLDAISPPYLANSVPSTSVDLSSIKTSTMPTINNYNPPSDTLTASIYNGYNSPSSRIASLPSYITVDSTTVSISPTLSSSSYATLNINVMIVLARGQVTSTTCFTVTLTNSPPTLQTGFTLSDQTVSVGSTPTYTILLHDPEGATCTLTITSSAVSYINQ